MTENIAEKIRGDRQPEGEMFDLAGEARRLRSSLAVAEKWYEVARDSDEPGDLAATAEYTRDQLEEELSKTAFRMEALRQRRVLREARGHVEDLDGRPAPRCFLTRCSGCTASCATFRPRPSAGIRRSRNATRSWGR